ncbi:MAG: hypothetical protein AAF357_11670 [Verrucomicrobiota bacterium]
MSTAKSLTENQITTIQQWAEEGAELSDIQKRLASELEIRVTYLETRFLLEDLKIELKPKEEPEPEEDALEEPVSENESEDVLDELPPESELPSGDEEVSVAVDKVLRPGALISGRATFAGGKSMAWWLDQMGQLGVDPTEPDFRPNENQLRSFQIALQRTIQESGM